MALANIYRVVQDLEGNVVTGVLGTVTLTGTSTLASLFADDAGTLPLPNPTTNNAQYGSFSLFLGAGTYDMQFVKAGFTFETQRNITLRDPAAGVNTITGTANRVIVAPVPGVGAVTLSTPQDIAPDSSVQFFRLGLTTPPSPTAFLTFGNTAGHKVYFYEAGPQAANTLVAAGVSVSSGNLDHFVSTGGTWRMGELASNAAYSVGMIYNAGTLTTVNDLVAGRDLIANRNLTVNASALVTTGLGVGASGGGERVRVNFNKSTQHGVIVQQTASDTAGNSSIVFVNISSGIVGFISANATATSYSTTSDARLKHDIVTLTGELALIQALRPVRFRWNADGSVGHGLLAQEARLVLPETVIGTEDGPLPLGVDYSKLVPWLVGAIQTLAQRVGVVEDAVGI